MNTMRAVLLLIASATLLCGAGCNKKSAPPSQCEELGKHAPVPDRAHALDLRIVAVNENGIDLELRNTGKEKLYLFDKFDPLFTVTSIEVRNGDRADLSPYAGADWLAEPDDILCLLPDDRIRRSIPRASLSSKPKRITFRVRYKVVTDSFFLEPWRKGMLSKDAFGKDYEAKLARIMQAWLGEAVSNEASFDFSAWPKVEVVPAQPAK